MNNDELFPTTNPVMEYLQSIVLKGIKRIEWIGDNGEPKHKVQVDAWGKLLDKVVPNITRHDIGEATESPMSLMTKMVEARKREAKKDMSEP